MTQAPTPGPLSGDDVNRECKDCGAFKAEHDAACSFCGLAPTAPVEASGSEREGEPTELEMQRAEVVTALLRYSFEGGAACDVADEIIGLLRPQPSGETQEAVSALMRKPLAAVTSLDGTVKMPMVCLSVEERDAILALIRPAPVAETAGEAVAMEIVSYDIYPGACWISPSRADEYRKEYGCVLRPLYASPVPAQDDDKLRIAVEALEKAEAEFEAIRLVLINHLNEPERAAFWKAVYGRGSAQDALATLKSTAAQEGRE